MSVPLTIMTREELRDWIAEQSGYTYDYQRRCWRFQDGTLHYDADDKLTHPVPDYLDAAAAAMPEGWDWERWRDWWAFRRTRDGLYNEIKRTADEITDRFRLAAMAIAHDKGVEYV